MARARGVAHKVPGAAESAIAVLVQGVWMTMSELESDRALQRYYLNEIHLLGGLCAGFNALTLQTIWTMYPFPLCMRIILDEHLSQELRGGYCVLVRHLYVQPQP